MTTDEQLTTDQIIDAFRTAGRVLPREAMAQAVACWHEVGPVLVAALAEAADAAEIEDDMAAILFFAIYLMAQVRDTSAFAPLCQLAATSEERSGRVLGDGVTESLAAILVRLYDGDVAPLRALVEAETADEFARAAALESLAWLTASGQIDRDETARYLRDLYENLRPQETSNVWVGWQQAISGLALDDLIPLVEVVFRDKRIDPSFMSFKHFQEDIQAAKEAVMPLATFDTINTTIDHLDDVATYLSTWDGFQPEQKRGRSREPAWDHLGYATHQPITNPLRNVGRNDPCPCGSGKKFKKCCLV